MSFFFFSPWFFPLSHLSGLWTSLYMSHYRPVRGDFGPTLYFDTLSLWSRLPSGNLLLESNTQKGYTTNYGIGNPIESFLWFTLLCDFFSLSPGCTFLLHRVPLDKTRENCITRCLKEPSTFKYPWNIFHFILYFWYIFDFYKRQCGSEMSSNTEIWSTQPDLSCPPRNPSPPSLHPRH